MAYDEDLAARVRALIGPDPELTETRMFGGLAFLVGGHIAVTASGRGGIMVRIDPGQADALLRCPGVTVVEMRGAPAAGWLRVTPEALVSGDSLATWVDRGVEYARSLAAR